MVGDGVYYLESQFRCFLRSAHTIPLIMTSSFLSFRKIRYAMIFLCCSYMGSWGFFGSTTMWSWNCRNYFRNEAQNFNKKCESLFKNFLGQDSLICDDVGWWSGFNKGDDSIYDVDIRLHNIVEVMGSDNQVYTSHGAPIDSSIIAFDGGRIF